MTEHFAINIYRNNLPKLGIMASGPRIASFLNRELMVPNQGFSHKELMIKRVCGDPVSGDVAVNTNYLLSPLQFACERGITLAGYEIFPRANSFGLFSNMLAWQVPHAECVTSEDLILKMPFQNTFSPVADGLFRNISEYVMADPYMISHTQRSTFFLWSSDAERRVEDLRRLIEPGSTTKVYFSWMADFIA